MTASALLKQSKALSPAERLSVAMALLRGGVSDETFERVRGELETVIAVEADKRVEVGVDTEIPLEEAMKRARAAAS